MTTAYLGDPAVKAKVIDRLRDHVVRGRLLYAPRWDGQSGSFAGVIAESDEVSAFTAATGFPEPLVLELEDALMGIKPIDAAASFIERVLADVPVGADLSLVTSRMVLELLDQPHVVEQSAASAELAAARTAIVDLHRCDMSGDPPDKREWRTARQAAIAGTNAAVSPLSRKVGHVIEAAAWPGTMKTVLADTSRTLVALRLAILLGEIGWTDADESRVFTTMEAWLADDGTSQSEKSSRGVDRILQVLTKIDSLFAERFRERLTRVEELNEHRIWVANRIAALLSSQKY